MRWSASAPDRWICSPSGRSSCAGAGPSRERPVSELRYAVVVPSLGRPSLRVLLDALAAAEGPRPEWLGLGGGRAPGAAGAVVDLRPLPDGIARHVLVLAGGGRGPAAARNLGW